MLSEYAGHLHVLHELAMTKTKKSNAKTNSRKINFNFWVGYFFETGYVVI